MAEKFTAQVTIVFHHDNYASAQNWLIKKLTEDEEKTQPNIQRVELVRWTDINTQRPVQVTEINLIEDDE